MGNDHELLAQRPAASRKGLGRFIPHVARVLMGLPLLVGGLNGLLHFFPDPSTPLPEGAVAFSNALMKTGYMFPLIFATQLIVGALLVMNRFVPLALAMIAPFIVNSMAFHIFLEPSGLIPAIVFLTFELYLAWSYRAAFRPMLGARNRPGTE